MKKKNKKQEEKRKSAKDTKAHHSIQALVSSIILMQN
jgi:hypothetical protein